MIEIRTSTATAPNQQLAEQPRQEGETNTAWLSRALGNADPAGTLVLIGGAGLGDFRLRIAQSHARSDLAPSFWSHVALISKPIGKADWGLYEISLEPAGGFGPVPLRNGVQYGSFKHYDDPVRYPNVACFRITVGPAALPQGDTLAAALERATASFQKQRSLVDAGRHMVDWLAFMWGVGAAANPLLANTGIPSAVFIESVFAIAGVELTPGVASNASCPEAIWQAMKWWHEYYLSEATLTQSAPSGVYIIGQQAAAAVYEPNAVVSNVKPRKRRS